MKKLFTLLLTISVALSVSASPILLCQKNKKEIKPFAPILYPQGDTIDTGGVKSQNGISLRIAQEVTSPLKDKIIFSEDGRVMAERRFAYNTSNEIMREEYFNFSLNKIVSSIDYTYDSGSKKLLSIVIKSITKEGGELEVVNQSTHFYNAAQLRESTVVQYFKDGAVAEEFTTRYEYDPLNRLNKEHVPGGSIITYTYHGETSQPKTLSKWNKFPNNDYAIALTTYLVDGRISKFEYHIYNQQAEIVMTQEVNEYTYDDTNGTVTRVSFAGWDNLKRRHNQKTIRVMRQKDNRLISVLPYFLVEAPSEDRDYFWRPESEYTEYLYFDNEPQKRGEKKYYLSGFDESNDQESWDLASMEIQTITPTKKISQSYIQGNEVNELQCVTESIYEYYPSGKLSRIVWKDANNLGVLEVKTTIEYDENGNRTIIESLGVGGSRLETSDYVYTQIGYVPLTSIEYRFVDNKWNPIGKQIATVDANGIIKALETSVYNNGWVIENVNERFENGANSYGFVTFDIYNDVLKPVNRVTINYNPQSYRMESMLDESNNAFAVEGVTTPDWKLKNKKEFIYQSDGKMIENSYLFDETYEGKYVDEKLTPTQIRPEDVKYAEFQTKEESIYDKPFGHKLSEATYIRLDAAAEWFKRDESIKSDIFYPENIDERNILYNIMPGVGRFIRDVNDDDIFNSIDGFEDKILSVSLCNEEVGERFGTYVFAKDPIFTNSRWVMKSSKVDLKYMTENTGEGIINYNVMTSGPDLIERAKTFYTANMLLSRSEIIEYNLDNWAKRNSVAEHRYKDSVGRETAIGDQARDIVYLRDVTCLQFKGDIVPNLTYRIYGAVDGCQVEMGNVLQDVIDVRALPAGTYVVTIGNSLLKFVK